MCMRLLTENDILSYHMYDNCNFLDSSDLKIQAQIVPQCSHIDAFKILFLRKYHAEKSESIRLVFSKKLNCTLLEIMTLNNYAKYDTHNLCPIEYVIRNFCKDKNNWMIIYKRNEYSTKIVCGYQNLVLNTRCVPAYTNLKQQINSTIKFINRRFKFDNVEIIDDVDREMLLNFAVLKKIHKSIYRSQNWLVKKCNPAIFVLLLALSLVIAVYEYRSFTSTCSEIYAVNKAIIMLRKNEPYGTPEFYKCIDELKSPLNDLRKIRYSDKTAVTGLSWNKKHIKIRNAKNEVKQFNAGSEVNL